MAGDWIKVETTTPEKPETFAIAERLGIPPEQAFGCLCILWIWADQQTVDGNAASVTKMLVDRKSGVIGFADSMIEVGWLIDAGNGLRFANFDRHNGETAKKRALTAKRVAKFKRESNAKGNAKGNAVGVTSALPREEKRREEKINTYPPYPPGLNVDAWNEYTAYRKKSGVKAYTAAGQAKQQAWLIAQGPPDIQQQIVDESIRNNWTGLFGIKGGKHEATGSTGKPSLAERATAARIEAERAVDGREDHGEPVGADDAHLRPPLDFGSRRFGG